jgi:hypothetical protein
MKLEWVFKYVLRSDPMMMLRNAASPCESPDLTGIRLCRAFSKKNFQMVNLASPAAVTPRLRYAGPLASPVNRRVFTMRAGALCVGEGRRRR